MKKLFLAAVLTVATAIGGYHYHNANKSQNLSEIAKTNIEALADLTPGSSETGPGKIVDCAGWGTGSRKECLCENEHPCIATQCQ